MAIRGVPTEILVAPDSFKGTLPATAVAAAIARGLMAGGRPAAALPLADGGEGTLAALAPALGLELLEVVVEDPLGREVVAAFGLAPPPAPRRGGARLAVVEMAAASGLVLVAAGSRDAVAATTYGTGQLIAAAVGAGAETVVVCVGGSATTDGGAGALRAVSEAGGLGRARLIVACDVRTPFEDAARVFAPQKGASADDVRRLTARLHRLARSYGRDPRGRPWTGAAGGLAGGLWAELGAELVAGAPFVLEQLGFDPRMRAARAVVTGEGRLDRQSLAGKLVSEVATRARQAGVPCHAVVGACELDAFGRRMLDLDVVLEASTPDQLESAGAELAALI